MSYIYKTIELENSMNMNEKLLDYIRNHPLLSSKEIYNGIKSTSSYPTIKRELTKLLRNNLVIAEGKGKGTKYRLSPSFEILYAPLHRIVNSLH